jgi:uncharacterized protein (TIGR02646 family)
MIQLPNHPLPDEAQLQLEVWQNEINAIPAYSAQIVAAKERFSLRNRASNPTFRAVRETLRSMCQGAKRCGYCEDSVGDEVEHVKPKDWYPSLGFVWENYLFACGPCNSPKGANYAIIIASGALQRLNRGDGPITPPPLGDPALIDPRTEDPFTLLELDIQNTFYFLPRYGASPRNVLRAEYTIELLRLNSRDHLVEARGNAFDSFKARLVEYNERKSTGSTELELRPLVQSLKRMPHQSVWKQMQRSWAGMNSIRSLFVTSPESLNW